MNVHNRENLNFHTVKPEEGCRKFFRNIGNFYHFDRVGHTEYSTVNMARGKNIKSHPFPCTSFAGTDFNCSNIWSILLLPVEIRCTVPLIHNSPDALIHVNNDDCSCGYKCLNDLSFQTDIAFHLDKLNKWIWGKFSLDFSINKIDVFGINVSYLDSNEINRTIL